jgi:hypothetical protein
MKSLPREILLMEQIARELEEFSKDKTYEPIMKLRFLEGYDERSLKYCAERHNKYRKITDVNPDYNKVIDWLKWHKPEVAERIEKLHVEADDWLGFRKTKPRIRRWMRRVIIRSQQSSQRLADSLRNVARIYKEEFEAGEEFCLEPKAFKNHPESLSPRREAAYQAFLYAEEKIGGPPSYEQAYHYLRENGPSDYELPPSVETFGKYVRDARRYHAKQKNSPRARRSHGSSIVEVDHIEYKSSQEAD